MDCSRTGRINFVAVRGRGKPNEEGVDCKLFAIGAFFVFDGRQSLVYTHELLSIDEILSERVYWKTRKSTCRKIAFTGGGIQMSVLIDSSITIYGALQNIKDGRYVMPACQRQYVWSMKHNPKDP